MQTDIAQCDFLVDSDFPLRYIDGKAPSKYEPRYIQDTDYWNVLKCVRFLDAENSAKLSRAFWIPGVKRLQWGEYCLLERKQ
jgi:alpha-1,2-mannosyltransferase